MCFFFLKGISRYINVKKHDILDIHAFILHLKWEIDESNMFQYVYTLNPKCVFFEGAQSRSAWKNILLWFVCFLCQLRGVLQVEFWFRQNLFGNCCMSASSGFNFSKFIYLIYPDFSDFISMSSLGCIPSVERLSGNVSINVGLDGHLQNDTVKDCASYCASTIIKYQTLYSINHSKMIWLFIQTEVFLTCRRWNSQTIWFVWGFGRQQAKQVFVWHMFI